MLTYDVDELVRIDLLHIKCKICTYYRHRNHAGRQTDERFAFQTVLMTWPTHCSVIEGYCRSDYAVTDSICILRCVSRARNRHCQDVRRSLPCKLMRNFFITGWSVIKPSCVVSANSPEHRELFTFVIRQVSVKRWPKNDGHGTVWQSIPAT